MTRLGRWEGYGGKGESTEPVPLPTADSMAADDIYVAPGPFIAGGDDAAPASGGTGPRRTVFLPSFVVRRTPVTDAEYLAFVNDLAIQGRTDEAIRCAPKVAGVVGFTWQPDLWCSSTAPPRWTYARWLAAREGKAWRLPTAFEWEKAARGVDGRLYPWGDYYHPPWSNLRDRNPTSPALLPVGSVPTDESPYGARDMAGNVREWTSDEVDGGPAGRQGVLKGGRYLDVSHAARCAGSVRVTPEHRDAMTGFRLAPGV